MMPTKLKALQESADRNKKLYAVKQPDPSLLEYFEFPAFTSRTRATVTAEVKEFTSLCPLTCQPDYGRIIIRYVVSRKNPRCLESKSLKLYTLGYRQWGAFHETIVRQIALDVEACIKPSSIHVQGFFKSRGGISFNPEFYIEGK